MSGCKPLWKVIFLALILGLPSQAALGDVFTFKGLERTNESWIREYLVLDSDKNYTEIELDQLRVKLLTAGIFTSVEVIRSGDQITVSVEEKWTTIPVARGEFGGGTPLRVFGIYDIHTWGATRYRRC